MSDAKLETTRSLKRVRRAQPVLHPNGRHQLDDIVAEFHPDQITAGKESIER